MISILIDFDTIIKNKNLKRLENKIKPLPKYNLNNSNNNTHIGLILIITKKEYRLLSVITEGDKKVQYINSKNFVKSISGYSYINYNKDQKICEIVKISENITNLNYIINTLLSNLPNDITLWISIPIDKKNTINTYENLKKYIYSSFTNPYISNYSLLRNKLRSKSICMTRKNNIIIENSFKFMSNNIKYILKQIANKNDVCSQNIKFSKETITYLKKICEIGITYTKNKLSQKEIAGVFTIKNIIKNVHILSINKNSIIYGDEESVECIPSLYNFHSHPKEAYEKNKLKYGWPSTKDYIVFLHSYILNNNILHAVCSIEGLYIISLGKHWASKKNKLKTNKNLIDFIKRKYDCKLIYNSPKHYVKHINTILYKKNKLFTLHFFPWNDSFKTFTIHYCKSILHND